ncbi:MAG: hypothetical protein LH473_01985 [Chitinophagales bacterium]|nr:hypothetical protein [Chitinophagales bacterium]
MKKQFLFAAIILLSCATKSNAQQTFKEALDDFHYVLAFTYHPMMDDSNFAPIKERSEKLAAAAEQVQNFFNKSDLKGGLDKSVEKLTEQCEALDEVIKKNASDEVIRVRLDVIHTGFHELEKLYHSVTSEK